MEVRGAVWGRLELRAEVAYRGFTLRRASFKGLREEE
jgi:hypothetical protein